MDKPTTVIIESRFAGDVNRNKAYAQACLLDSLNRGESPFMSHLLYTQVLDDKIPEQRLLGIQAGLVFGRLCDKTIVYTDLGISEGMEMGIEDAKQHGRIVEFRTIENYVTPVTPDELAAELWGIPDTRILKKKIRLREVVEARMVLMAYRRHHLKETCDSAAANYGLKYGATGYASRTINNLMKTNKVFKKKYETFHEILNKQKQ